MHLPSVEPEPRALASSRFPCPFLLRNSACKTGNKPGTNPAAGTVPCPGNDALIQTLANPFARAANPASTPDDSPPAGKPAAKTAFGSGLHPGPTNQSGSINRARF